TNQDRIGWIAGLGFDASVWEIFAALGAGATLVVPPDPVRPSASTLARWLVEERVTVAFAPTPLAEVMIREALPAQTRLGLLVTGGEALHVRPRLGLPFEVINNYGPTECTVVATSGRVAPGAEEGAPTLGRPLPLTRIEIVGEDGRPVRPGEVGE